ncbi:hypothetical protein UFOVP75_191 [uncultured Caudovirales phage]|uniref:Uncharacterized protein n=1 Tax=uncultured Caudovirales phage TaxID=2100421 RepID=A0A6J5L2H8_9CAUD|nr:hypothetical protein UFOVP75_191 [uncultured Caudovirales phage]
MTFSGDEEKLECGCVFTWGGRTGYFRTITCKHHDFVLDLRPRLFDTATVLRLLDALAELENRNGEL